MGSEVHKKIQVLDVPVSKSWNLRKPPKYESKEENVPTYL